MLPAMVLSWDRSVLFPIPTAMIETAFRSRKLAASAPFHVWPAGALPSVSTTITRCTMSERGRAPPQMVIRAALRGFAVCPERGEPHGLSEAPAWHVGGHSAPGCDVVPCALFTLRGQKGKPRRS